MARLTGKKSELAEKYAAEFFRMKQRSSQHWDACVLGSDMSCFWTVLILLKQGSSVLWVRSSPLQGVEGMTLQHAWFWDVEETKAQWLCDKLGMSFDSTLHENLSFGNGYYDAKTSKRFHSTDELQPEWGEHESEYFKNLLSVDSTKQINFANLAHQLLKDFSAETLENLTQVEGLPVNEILTDGHKVCGLTISGFENKKLTSITIEADQYFFGSYMDGISNLIKNPEDSKKMATAFKGRSFSSGFGLQFTHKAPFETAMEQNAIVPLFVNPSKDSDRSHLIGRFSQDKLKSFWIGFFTTDELEDNNEILKKIRHSTRAIERAYPSFAESVENEVVSFDVRMTAIHHKKEQLKPLGANLISDQMGLSHAMDMLMAAFGSTDVDPSEKSKSKPEAKTAESTL